MAESPGCTIVPTRCTKSSEMPKSSFQLSASSAPAVAPSAPPLTVAAATAAAALPPPVNGIARMAPRRPPNRPPQAPPKRPPQEPPPGPVFPVRLLCPLPRGVLPAVVAIHGDRVVQVDHPAVV